MSSPKSISNCHEIFTQQQLCKIQQMIDCSLKNYECPLLCQVEPLKKEVCRLESKLCLLDQRIHSNAECTVKAVSALDKRVCCLEHKPDSCSPVSDCRIDTLVCEVTKLQCQVVELQKADHAYVGEFKKINCKLHEYDETFCKISKIDTLQEKILCKMQKQISTLQCEIDSLKDCCTPHCPQPTPCPQQCESPSPCPQQYESHSQQPCREMSINKLFCEE